MAIIQYVYQNDVAYGRRDIHKYHKAIPRILILNIISKKQKLAKRIICFQEQGIDKGKRGAPGNGNNVYVTF